MSRRDRRAFSGKNVSAAVIAANLTESMIPPPPALGVGET